MDRASKLQKLEHFRRKCLYASVSFCSSILIAVKADPCLAEGPSNRAHFKKARDDVALDDRTAFGPIRIALKLVQENGEAMDTYVAHPFAVL